MGGWLSSFAAPLAYSNRDGSGDPGPLTSMTSVMNNSIMGTSCVTSPSSLMCLFAERAPRDHNFSSLVGSSEGHLWWGKLREDI